jgi:hypothetical protein
MLLLPLTRKPRKMSHGTRITVLLLPLTRKLCVLCGFSQNFPTKQLLRKKILKKNLYRPGILGELGIMSKINPYLLPVVPVVPVQKLSN